ncbi:hypothetical protein LGK97_00680 [Clostridium sp. CS001]|uniref:hypothetical protein n=1 Tax=Clostridium sp. CS001 TaxID=2880648 RepID=UPI001CF13990|nr:hypothetical protein [Clostridium sp. CS001]MCB2288279.1 hypothetical protein [Clostridium sp. CS001]
MEISKIRLMIILAIAIPVLLIQGAWVFYDARKRKEKYYWLWGVFALINTPGNLIIYLLVTRVILNSKNKGSS